MSRSRERAAEAMDRYPARLSAGVAASFFLGGTVASHGLFSAEMASWVQAIGSIAANWVAISLGRQQSQSTMEALKLQLADQQRRDDGVIFALRESAVVLLVNTMGRIVMALNTMKRHPPKTPKDMGAIFASCNGVETMLASFPIHLVGDAQAISWFIEARSGLQVALEHLRIASQSNLSDQNFGSSLKSVTNSMIFTVNGTRMRIDLYIEKFGLTVPNLPKLDE